MTLASAGAALLFHVAVLAAIGVVGVNVVGEGLRGGKSSQATAEETELESSCAGDVLLVAAARTGLCLTPWADELELCWHGLSTQAWFDLADCSAQGLPSTEFALLTPAQEKKLTPIDPEPLLEQAKLLPPTP
ncbi:MAG TPA: hypothetical protein PKU97_25165, partial [Kofleriaceae bacterium]|nr:hypothetical protein [Kofleriaceae bacterium]